MSNSFAPNAQTRQQLEELDALLQRMLALPTTGGDDPESARPLPMSAKIPVPLPPNPASYTVREMPQPGGADATQPRVQGWRIELPNPNSQAPVNPVFSTWATPYSGSMQGNSLNDAPTPMVYGQPAASGSYAPTPQPAASMQPVALSIPESPRDEEPPLSPIWWPFFLLNLVYDLATQILGPLTSWLSAPATKHALGWLGVAMVVLSIGFGISLWLGFDWSADLFAKR